MTPIEQTTAAEFRRQLQSPGLLSPQHFEEFHSSTQEAQSSAELAEFLIGRKMLTRFQARALLQGRGPSLRLGSYVLLNRIGAGGMGQVYLGRHVTMKSQAAIKILPQNRGSQRHRARFQREIEVAAKLRHPNIVSAFDAGEDRGVYFLAMEYVVGTDLAAFVKKRGPVEPARAVDWTLQAAKGLHFAHESQVIHRDVKPANLLLDRQGVVRVLDLGLARRLEDEQLEDAGITRPDTLMGTLDYLAPEQAEDARRADARSDVYSLGCTLYYLLTGAAIYAEETELLKILAHRDQPIPSLPEAALSFSEDLDAVFRKMVAKNPDDRFADMQSVATALEGILEGRSQQLLSLSLREASPRFSASAAGTRGQESEVTAEFDQVASLDLGDFLQGNELPGLTRLEQRPVSRNRRNQLAIGVSGALSLVLLLAILYSASNSAQTPRPGATAVSFQALEDSDSSGDTSAATIPEYKVNSIGMQFVRISAGEFMMGSELMNDNQPHQVRLTKSIEMGVYEVTQREYEQVTGGNPSHFSGDDLPVEMVSWHDAMSFCLQLSALSGEQAWTYQLPSESQWEYACRGASAGRFSFGDDQQEAHRYAWHLKNSDETTHPVGQLRPNSLGLYDMNGNVGEYCSEEWINWGPEPQTDPFSRSGLAMRIVKGGAWNSSSAKLEPGWRTPLGTNNGDSTVGFRVIRVLKTSQ